LTGTADADQAPGEGPKIRLVFVTQLVDAADPTLGFVTEWIRQLALQCSDLVVIANEVRHDPGDLGAKVISLGKEKGAGTLRRGVRYQTALIQVLARRRPHALLAHMCPIYLTLAYPLTKLMRVRTLLWFAHPADRPALRIAERLAGTLLTSFSGAFPHPNAKLRVIGQGIETEAFHPDMRKSDQPKPHPLKLLALGRTSPYKGYPTAIRAVAKLKERGLRPELRIVGPSTTLAEVRHRQELAALIKDLGVGKEVSLEQGLDRTLVAESVLQAGTLVNTTDSGSGDKVILEAMAAETLVVFSNPALAELVAGLPVDLTFAPGNSHALAETLQNLSNAKPSQLDEVAKQLRQRVEQGHSVQHWACQVTTIVREMPRRAPLKTKSALALGAYRQTVKRVAPLHKLTRALVVLAGDALVRALSLIRRFRVPEDKVLSAYKIRMLTGRYEASTLAVCKKLARPGMTIFDIGAHAGYFTLAFARLAGPDGQVYAFEPHPNTFKLLQSNAARSGLPNMVLKRLAISNAEGSATLYDAGLSMGHSLVKEKSHVAEFTAETTTLDAFVKQHRLSNIGLIKMDAEGAEMEILDGMRMLAREADRLAVILEFKPEILKLRNTGLKELVAQLRSLGFLVHKIEDNGGTLALDSEKSLELASLAKCNLLALKG